MSRLDELGGGEGGGEEGGGGGKGEGARKKRVKRRTDETLCKLTLYGFRRGWLLIDSAERVARWNKKCNGASLVTSRYIKPTGKPRLFLAKMIERFQKKNFHSSRASS